jgi:hypothetical protein
VIPSAKECILAEIQAGNLNATVIELVARINLTHEACYRALGALYDDEPTTQLGR